MQNLITAHVELTFDDPDFGYIAHPYTSDMNTLIDVQKQSGVNRARSESARNKCLEEWLRKNGKDLEWYTALEERAHRPFYTNADGQIIIPAASFMSFLVNTNDTLRSANRFCERGQERSRTRARDFLTGKREADGKFERFAVVTLGTGQKASNQRGFRSNEYIRDFVALGSVLFDSQYVKPPALENAIRHGGEFIGIGASRKMGWGRFRLTRFECANN